MGGAGGPVTFRHVIEYCDGWMPIHGRRPVLDKLPVLRAAAEDAGRDPDSIELGVFGVPGDPAVVEDYRAAGFARCVLGVPSAGESTVRSVLDGYADLVAQYA